MSRPKGRLTGIASARPGAPRARTRGGRSSWLGTPLADLTSACGSRVGKTRISRAGASDRLAQIHRTVDPGHDAVAADGSSWIVLDAGDQARTTGLGAPRQRNVACERPTRGVYATHRPRMGAVDGGFCTGYHGPPWPAPSSTDWTLRPARSSGWQTITAATIRTHTRATAVMSSMDPHRQTPVARRSIA